MWWSPTIAVAEAAPPMRWQNWGNLAAYVVNCAVTYGANAGAFGETNTTLSKKYQTLVTPAPFAFAIWGLIFIGEGVFAVAQLLPGFRQSRVVGAVAVWWWSACAFQAMWSVIFSLELIGVATVLIFCILASLLGLIQHADATSGPLSLKEYLILRLPFSLHAGWVLAASALSISVVADWARATPAALLATAMVSLTTVICVQAVLTVAGTKPDPVVCIAAAWAFFGIRSELRNPAKLLDPGRANAYEWEPVVLESLSLAAFAYMMLSVVLAALAAYMRITGKRCDAIILDAMRVFSADQTKSNSGASMEITSLELANVKE